VPLQHALATINIDGLSSNEVRVRRSQEEGRSGRHPAIGRPPEKLKEALVKAIPFRRLARPEEVAAPVLFFASDAASFITGQVISVSGGLTMAG